MSNTDNSLNRSRVIGLFLKSQALTDLNRDAFFDEHFYFEEPIVINTLPTNKNTKITVTAKASSEYFGRKTLRYNRIHETDIPTFTVEIVSEVSLYELLSKINNKYGTFLTEQDVEDIDISTEPAGDYSPVLVVKNTSLIFYSGTKVILTP